jgi:hypothetical protein
MSMVLNKISDIDKLPSVLRIEEVNMYFMQLMSIINSDPKLEPLIAAEAINNLIGYQGYNTEGLSREVSLEILEWTKRIYKPDDDELVDCCCSNLANLTCKEAGDYLQELISNSISNEEKVSLQEALNEIDVKA